MRVPAARLRPADLAEHVEAVVVRSKHRAKAITTSRFTRSGLFVVACGFGPLIFAIWHAFRSPAWRTRPAQAMIAATAAAAVSIALISFGIWQEWFLSGLFVAAAFIVLSAREFGAAAHGTIRSMMGGRQS